LRLLTPGNIFEAPPQSGSPRPSTYLLVFATLAPRHRLAFTRGIALADLPGAGPATAPTPPGKTGERRQAVQFRWVAFITLWTFLVGPILGAPSGSAKAHRKAASAVVKPAPARR
jgi:hypothetical protein